MCVTQNFIQHTCQMPRSHISVWVKAMTIRKSVARAQINIIYIMNHTMQIVVVVLVELLTIIVQPYGMRIHTILLPLEIFFKQHRNYISHVN